MIPPAPPIHQGPLSTWRMVRETTRNLAGVWSDNAFDDLVGRRKALGVDSLLLSDPEGVRHVLTDKAGAYGRPAAFVRPIRPLGGKGVLLAEGTEWRRQRRMLAPVFTPGRMEALTPHFEAAAEALLGRLEPRANLSQAFHDAALDAVLRALFSLPPGEERAGMAGAVRRYLEGAGRPNVFDGLARAEGDFAFATGSRRRFARAWRPQVDALVATRRAAADASDSDLLGLLLSARDPETGEPLSDEEIRDQTATMLVAGFETTSRLLFWAAYLLALDPQEQDRVRADVALHGAASPRLRQVLLETLRLYPPVAVLLREARASDHVAGEDIQPGVLVWISPWVMHRHRRFWDEPTAFKPGRFEGKANAFLTEPAYLPFGAGPRICIGASFAMSEAAIILSRLLSARRIGLESARPVLPVSLVTTAPDHEPWFALSPA